MNNYNRRCRGGSEAMGWNAGLMCDMSVWQLEMLSKEMAQHANCTAEECMPPIECTWIKELTHSCMFRTEGVVDLW